MISEVNHDLPYEKFRELGPENLTEAELLAIILRTGTRELSALELAKEVLAITRYPKEGLVGLYDLSLEDLMQIKGIGIVKATKIKCIAELSVRIARAKAKTGIVFRNSAKVADYYMETLRHRSTECVYLLCLDSKGQLIKELKLSDGSVKASLISPREIFLAALNCRAVNLILLHNHPSGDPSPSNSDIEITTQLKNMGEQLEIPLLDHIIIGDKRYTSFKESGII